MSFPSFSSGDVLTAADMNAVGLWLVKTQTVGTTVSSVTVSDAFSSTYENYRIIYTGGSGSTNLNLNFTLGAANTGYHYSFLFSLWNNTASAAGSSTGTSFANAGAATSTWAHAFIELRSPFATNRTHFNSHSSNSAGGVVGVGFLDNATSYTGFTFTCSTGTITGGTIRVYGYRN